MKSQFDERTTTNNLRQVHNRIICPECATVASDYDACWQFYLSAMDDLLASRKTGRRFRFNQLKAVADAARENSEAAHLKFNAHKLGCLRSSVSPVYRVPPRGASALSHAR